MLIYLQTILGKRLSKIKKKNLLGGEGRHLTLFTKKNLFELSGPNVIRIISPTLGTLFFGPFDGRETETNRKLRFSILHNRRGDETENI